MVYLKFPHLDLLWTHMAELVECFNRHCFTIMFVNTLNYDDLISVKICIKYKNSTSTRHLTWNTAPVAPFPRTLVVHQT